MRRRRKQKRALFKSSLSRSQQADALSSPCLLLPSRFVVVDAVAKRRRLRRSPVVFVVVDAGCWMLDAAPSSLSRLWEPYYTPGPATSRPALNNNDVLLRRRYSKTKFLFHSQ